MDHFLADKTSESISILGPQWIDSTVVSQVSATKRHLVCHSAYLSPELCKLGISEESQGELEMSKLEVTEAKSLKQRRRIYLN